MTPNRTLRAALAILVAGCSGGDTQPDASRGDEPVEPPSVERPGVRHVDILSCEGLEDEILGRPLSREELSRLHGAPDSIIAWIEPNRHIEGKSDSLFTVHYPGFNASFRVPSPGRDLIIGASVTSNRFVADPSVGIGASENDILSRLGQPTRRDGAHLIYECGDVVEQPVTFELRNGVVFAIDIAYYVD